MKHLKIALWTLVAIAIGYKAYEHFNAKAPIAEVTTLSPAQTIMRQDYTLVDHNNQPITKANLLGHPSLVFFGFTNCPDICPAAMADVSLLLKDIAQTSPLKAYLVSVDPDRDTPEALKNFIQSFDTRIIGITGDVENMTKIKQDFHVYAKKVELKEKEAATSAPSEYPAPAQEPATPPAVDHSKHAHHHKSNYTLDHTASIFLLNAKGELAGTLSPSESMDVKMKKVQKLLAN